MQPMRSLAMALYPPVQIIRIRLNAEARELEERISENVVMLLEEV